MNLNVVSNLRRHADNQPGKLALVEGTRRWTYGELWDQAAHLAGVLTQRGVGRGDRVALVSANRAEHVVALYAINAAGAVAVPLPARAPGEVLERMITDAACVALIWGGPVASVPGGVAALLPRDRVLAMDETEEPDGRALDALLRAATPGDAMRIEPDDELVILYSSGTTGTPKGMVLTHRCRVAYALGFCAEFGLSRSDTFVLLTPMYHNGAQMWLHSALYAGATVVVAHDIGEVLDPIDPATPQTTVTFIVPAQLRDLGERAGGRDRAPLTVVTGTMPVGAAVKLQALERMPCAACLRPTASPKPEC
jgi:acyl-CoA synthetase (AMP-forming)/AMP-acid ligase II